MTERNLNGKIIQAFYTTEELSQEPLCNIVIDEGLVVYEKCDNEQVKMKIGDGVNTWSHLKYIEKNSEINDEQSSTTSTYSSSKVENLLNEKSGFELTSTLLAEETTLVFTDERITSNSMLTAVYTSIFDTFINSAEFANGSLTLEFTPQDNNMDVKVLIDATFPSYMENSNNVIDERILTFNTTNDTVNAYVSSARLFYPSDDTITIVNDYVNLNIDNDKPNKYTLTNLFDGEIYFTDETTGSSFKDTVTGNSYDIYNLIPKHIYRYVVTNENGIQKVGRIKDMADIRMIYCEEAFNVRDIGGREADGGTVNYGLIYRGARLVSSSGSLYLSNYDQDLFRNRLNIDYEIDMRRDDEVFDINATTSAIGANVTYDRLPMSSGYTSGFAHNSSEITQAKTIIQTIMQNAVNGVVTYIHCSAGADRTGTVASILNGILGVSQLDLDIDFELTSMTPRSDYLRPRYAVDGYGAYWKDWKDYIDGLGGSNPYVTWCKSVGIPIALINAYREAMIDGQPTTILPDTNAILSSVDVNGEPYNNGIGYLADMRLNSSGGETEQTGQNCFVTGYMPFVKGQTLQFQNILFAGNSNVEGYDYIHRVTVYDENKTLIETKQSVTIATYSDNVVEMDGNYITQVTLNTISSSADMSLVRYIRISGVFSENGTPAIYIS